MGEAARRAGYRPANVGVVVMGPMEGDGKCGLSPVTCHCGREHELKLSPKELRRRTDLLIAAKNSTDAMLATMGKPALPVEEIRALRRRRRG